MSAAADVPRLARDPHIPYAAPQALAPLADLPAVAKLRATPAPHEQLRRPAGMIFLRVFVW